MKHDYPPFKLLFATLMCCAFTGLYAQIAPGIKYSYGPGGFRIKREYLTSTSFARGTSSNGSQADTVIIATPEKNWEYVLAKAYPNPVNDLLFIENFFWQEGSSATIKIQNILGEQILEKYTKLSKESVSLNHVAPGTYTVNYYVNNAFFASWKIIKL